MIIPFNLPPSLPLSKQSRDQLYTIQRVCSIPEEVGHTLVQQCRTCCKYLPSACGLQYKNQPAMTGSNGISDAPCSVLTDISMFQYSCSTQYSISISIYCRINRHHKSLIMTCIAIPICETTTIMKIFLNSD